MIEYYLQGLTMGLAYVAPIGLQNLFVINSALMHTRRRALLTALIVTFFDVMLSLACFFSIGTVMQHYVWLKLAVLLFGSLMVIYIGIGLLWSKAESLDTNLSLPVLSRPLLQPAWSPGLIRRRLLMAR